VAEEQDRIAIPLAWVESDEPVTFANQFMTQRVTETELLLLVGQAFPPPIIGSPDQQLEQARQIPFVPVRTLGRYSLTRERVVELVNLLQRLLESTTDAARGDE
jgi:hypothetical protein